MRPRKRNLSHQSLQKQVAGKEAGRKTTPEAATFNPQEPETSTIDQASSSMAVTTQKDHETAVPG